MVNNVVCGFFSVIQELPVSAGVRDRAFIMDIEHLHIHPRHIGRCAVMVVYLPYLGKHGDTQAKRKAVWEFVKTWQRQLSRMNLSACIRRTCYHIQLNQRSPRPSSWCKVSYFQWDGGDVKEREKGEKKGTGGTAPAPFTNSWIRPEGVRSCSANFHAVDALMSSTVSILAFFL